VCRSIPRFVVDLEKLPVARAARESRQIADIFRVALRVRTNGTFACEGGAHLQIKLIGGTGMVWFRPFINSARNQTDDGGHCVALSRPKELAARFEAYRLNR